MTLSPCLNVILCFFHSFPFSLSLSLSLSLCTCLTCRVVCLLSLAMQRIFLYSVVSLSRWQCLFTIDIELSNSFHSATTNVRDLYVYGTGSRARRVATSSVSLLPEHFAEIIMIIGVASPSVAIEFNSYNPLHAHSLRS